LLWVFFLPFPEHVINSYHVNYVFMENVLPVSFLQTNTVWEEPEKNQMSIVALIEGKDLSGHLVVLPEMFTTGFSMCPESLAEKMDGKSVQWMQEQAALRNCVFTGSLIIQSEQGFMNRLIWAGPDGYVAHYDKKHLFRMGEENKYYSAGTQKVIIEYKGWRFRPLICYDLRFPVWSRNRSDYDVLIYVANWPKNRREVWNTLLIARALENQAYVVGVNRVGADGRNISYNGDSVIISPEGEVLAGLKPGEEGFGTADISLDELNEFRNKFPVHLDADDFSVT